VIQEKPAFGFEYFSTAARGRNEKKIVIKIIKRKTAAAPLPSTMPASTPRTVTSTVKDWIAESRQSRLDRDRSSRKTIAGWATESTI